MQFRYKILPEFLTKEECDLLLNFSLKNLKLDTATLANTTGEAVKTYDDKGRKSKSM